MTALDAVSPGDTCLLKTLVVQMVLTLIAGPIGLAFSNVRTALIATLFTLATVLVFNGKLLLIWLIAMALSTITGVLLIRAKYQRHNIDNFQLSTYVGTVCCRVIKKGRVPRSYQPVLNRLRLRKKINRILNGVLACMCVVLTALIVNPQWTDYLRFVQSSQHTATSATTERVATQMAKQKLSLLQETDNGFTLKSSNFVPGKNGNHRALLTIACTENRTSLSLSTDDVLGTSDSSITLHLNGNEKVDQIWKIDDQLHQARARSPISTLRRINSSENISVQYRPFGHDTDNKAQFDIESIRQATAIIRKRCHW